jgi:hypothetical protein
MSVFYPNQIKAGDDVVALFQTSQVDIEGKDKIHYVLLQADVQVGKTGTYNYIAQQMLSEGLVDQVYVLCGSSEIDLRDQAIEDAMNYNPVAVADGKMTVIFRGAFKDFYLSASTPLVMERTLIIVDESHLDQARGQELSLLLAEYGLNMSGTLPIMMEKKTFILSVDATPYSELAALNAKPDTKGGKSLPKGHVVLEPGEGYFGPRDYIRGGLLKSMVKEISVENAGYFRNVIRKHCGVVGSEKYAIVRAEGKKLETLKSILTRTDILVRSFNIKKTDISISDLAMKPSHPTVVFVSGRLRAGKVVPKEHIGFVWETSTSPKTDVMIQGLWGRMCGYRFGETKPLIVLPRGNKNNCVKDIMRFEKGLNPMRATNVTGTHKEHKVMPWDARFQCPPIRLDSFTGLDEEVIDLADDGAYLDLPSAIRSARKGTSGVINRIRDATHTLFDEKREDIEMRIRDAHFLSAEQKNEIIERMNTVDPEEIHVRRMDGTSQKTYFADLLRAEVENTTTIEHQSKKPYFTVVSMVDHRGYLETLSPEYRGTFEAGSAWLVCYTDAESMEAVRYKGPKHGEENNKSVFSIHDLLERPDSLPEGPVGLLYLTDDALRSADEFYSQLYEMVKIWRERRFGITPVLKNASGSYAFSKSAFAHESSKKNSMLTLVKGIERDFQCKIQITFGKGRTSATHFKVEEIRWGTA